jgi:hypothetical protein
MRFKYEYHFIEYEYDFGKLSVALTEKSQSKIALKARSEQGHARPVY